MAGGLITGNTAKKLWSRISDSIVHAMKDLIKALNWQKIVINKTENTEELFPQLWRKIADDVTIV